MSLVGSPMFKVGGGESHVLFGALSRRRDPAENAAGWQKPSSESVQSMNFLAQYRNQMRSEVDRRPTSCGQQ